MRAVLLHKRARQPFLHLFQFQLLGRMQSEKNVQKTKIIFFLFASTKIIAHCK